MAKPMHPGRAGCSPGPSSCSQQPNPQPKRRRHHSQRAPSSSSSSPGPSSSLLSLLAAVAASTASVNGSPAPLPFLCPSFAQNPVVENFEPRGLPARRVESDGTDIPDYPSVPRHVPDRYQIGDDGRWRLVEEYTLYGSTVCPSCREPTNAVTSVDDQIQGAGSPLSDSTTSPTPSDEINLPPGWKAPSGINKARTTLIIVLSLVLAFVICFFIIGCLFWRKSQRRKLKHRDVEARLRRRSTPVEDDREAILEKEMRVKQKIWARATARWKANVRHSARQRRGKRIASTTRMSQAQHSTASIDQPPDGSAAPTPVVLSRTVSQRSSMESMYATSSAIEATTDPPLSPEQDSPSPSTSSPISSSRPSPSSPPAYQQPLQIQSNHNAGTGQLIITPTSSQYYFCSRCNSSHPSASSSDICAPALHAHVATDDKNLLARLAGLASSPPSEDVLTSEAEPSIPEVSAPAWDDEELGDFREPYPDSARSHSSSSNSSSRTPPAPLFPSPPSKGKMSGPNFYDYPYTFDDISMDPEVGPAAPPFEAGPSAPPADDIDLTPSAPPLMEDDTYYIATHASAPILGWEPPEDTDRVGTGTHDQEDMMPTNHPRQPDTYVPAMDTTLTPSVQGPVASDGTLPSYHP